MDAIMNKLNGTPLSTSQLLELKAKYEEELEKNPTTSTLTALKYLYELSKDNKNSLWMYGIQHICHFPYKVDGKYNEAIYIDKMGISANLGRNYLIVRNLFDNDCYFKYKHKINNKAYRHYRLYYVDIDEFNDKCSFDLIPQLKEKIKRNIECLSEENPINSQTADNMLEIRMAGRMNNINNSYETNITTLNDEYRDEYILLIEKKKFVDSIGQQGVPTKLNELTEYLKQSFITNSDNFVHNFLIKFDYTNTIFPILFIEFYKTGFDDEFDELLRNK